MLALVLAAWTSWAAPDPVDAVTARIAPPLRVRRAATEPVRVVVEGDASALAAAMADIPGARVEVVVDGEVQVTVPAGRIRDLAMLPGAAQVREPFEAIEFDVITPGLDLLLVQDWHALGLTGAGVKVAVLDTGFSGYQSLLGTELPASVGFDCHRADQPSCTTADHGTAVAEIVHDMAPDAEITLIGAFLGSEWLEAADVIAAGDFDVVTCSMGFGNYYPLDGDNPFAEKLDEAVTSSGVLWFQAAGNENTATWTGIVTDTDTDAFLEMEGSEEIPILLFPGPSVVLDVRWDDPWGGANDDIDLVLVARDGGGSEVAVDPSACPTYNGQRPQTGLAAHTPWERLDCTLPGNVTTAALKMRVDAGTGAGHRVWLQNYADLPEPWWAYERSISIPSDARKAIAIGALGSAPGDQFVRDYSGRGPTDDGRIKPDLMGPSPGDTVTRDGFSGTSAATPHIAGLAALVVQDADGALTRDQILAWMIAQSTDLGPAGKDNAYGDGLPQLDDPWSSGDTGDTGDTGTDTGDTGDTADTDTADTDTGVDTDTDTGVDTDSGVDSDSGEDLPDIEECGCTVPGTPEWAAFALVALLVGRRRVTDVRHP